MEVIIYQNIFIDKKNEKIHLWDDIKGYIELPLSSIRYAYRRQAGGKYKSLYGDELEKIYNFDEHDPSLFESDVNLEMKALLDVYEGNDEPSIGHRIVIIDIEVDSTGGFPNVDVGDRTITAIALYDQVGDHYYSFVLDPEGKVTDNNKGNVETRSFRNEERLLLTFLDKWEEIKPTIVSGWNSSGNGKTTFGFDIPYIFNRIRAVLGKKESYRLSPIKIVYQNKFNKKMVVAGISCLDYMELYKKFVGVMKSSWSLANVAKDEELKHQKLTYKGSLTDLYKNDIHRYVEYNLTDVMVVVELDKKYDFIYLARSVCHKGHVPYEWFQMSSRFIDGAILMYLRRHNLVGPNKPVGGREEYEEMEKSDEKFIGAYVKEPVVGLYDWIYSSDITSLYPSTIITLNISPETKVGKIEGWNREEFESGNIPLVRIGDQSYSAADFKKMIANYTFSISSNGMVYRQDLMGVVPTILDLWFKERLEYRAKAAQFAKDGDKEQEAFYDRRQKRQKIFLNSVYGTLGLPIFRFYDRDNAEAVTISGQEIIRSAERMVNDTYVTKFKAKGIEPPTQDFVKYIDTDSLYASSLPLAQLEGNVKDMTQFTIELVTEISDKINRFYAYMIPRVFNVAPEKNRIKIVPDVIAEKALWIAKKRYAMLKVYDMEKKKPVKDKNGLTGKLEVKGIDVVRSSYPASFRKFSAWVIDAILRSVPREEIDEKIMHYEETIESCSVFDLAKTSSVKFISQKRDINYNPPGRKLFEFVLKSSAQVKGALCYNDLLKVWKLDKQYEKIGNSEKIKWIYLLPNEFFIEQLAVKADDTDPDQILEFFTNNIDRNKMYERELRSKLEEIYSAIGLKMPNRGSQLAEKMFDFSEEF